MTDIDILCDKPLSNPDVKLFQYKDNGKSVYVLRNEKEKRYYRVSAARAVVWKACATGKDTIAEICLKIEASGASVEKGAIVEVIQDLAAKRLVVLATDIPSSQEQQSRQSSILTALVRTLTWRVQWSNVDEAFDVAYRIGGHLFFKAISLVAILSVSLIGCATFIMSSVPRDTTGYDYKLFLFILVPFTFLTMLLHEFAHAIAVKHFRRKVLGVGVGWFWVGPFLYVDTSDMWVCPRRERIIVNIAGPLTNLTIGSLLMLFSLLYAGEFQDGLIAAAAAQYFIVIFNLSPFLEYDGYYILTDILDRPNLRNEISCLLFGRRSLNHAADIHGRLSNVDMIYLVTSAVYFCAMFVWTFLSVDIWARGFVQGYLEIENPSFFSIAVAGAFALILAIGLTYDLLQRARNFPRLKGPRQYE